MNLVSDLDIFFADFGVPAVITQPGHPDLSTTALFDQFGLVENGVLTDKPQLVLSETVLSGVDTKTASVTVNGVTWNLMKPLADGFGLVTCGLKRI